MVVLAACLQICMQGATSAPADVGRTNSSSAHAGVVGRGSPPRSLGVSAGLRARHARHHPGEQPAEQGLAPRGEGLFGDEPAQEHHAPGRAEGVGEAQVEDNIAAAGDVPQASNGTTVGQLLAAGGGGGAASVLTSGEHSGGREPEMSYGSHADGAEQQQQPQHAGQPPGLATGAGANGGDLLPEEALSPASGAQRAAGHAAAARAAAFAVSANIGTMPPPMPRSAARMAASSAAHGSIGAQQAQNARCAWGICLNKLCCCGSVSLTILTAAACSAGALQDRPGSQIRLQAQPSPGPPAAQSAARSSPKKPASPQKAATLRRSSRAWTCRSRRRAALLPLGTLLGMRACSLPALICPAAPAWAAARWGALKSVICVGNQAGQGATPTLNPHDGLHACMTGHKRGGASSGDRHYWRAECRRQPYRGRY